MPRSTEDFAIRTNRERKPQNDAIGEASCSGILYRTVALSHFTHRAPNKQCRVPYPCQISKNNLLVRFVRQLIEANRAPIEARKDF
ncbi:hypothetical protein F7734_23615 [Scytonema sp. UIC 10036]|uniref:hypothetical protein n=1 Tax=Scytonema sp. UIC 10036 TaxID=2304196 RepID=UPI0012DA06B5|nr:hypothetical protein [Scytonema sp. UIC 10036]MUG95182.1 hypothetical protein [Scytonema sp. UIC 10036]